MGKAIEPAISPLRIRLENRYLLLSVCPGAREVFVGTLATIYSVGGSENEVTIKNKTAEVNPLTGEKIFNFTGISLLLFYAFKLSMRKHACGH
jgi:ferrous iron transport protein B